MTCRSLALGWHVASLEAELQEIAHLESAIHYLAAGLELIHHFQRERGASCLYLGSDGNGHREALAQYREESDRHLLRFLASLPDIPEEDCQRLKIGFRQSANLALVLAHLAELVPLRAEIDRCQSPRHVAIHRYSALLSGMLSFLFSTSESLPITGEVYLYVVLYYLAETKEFAGQERAWGALGLESGGFQPDEQARLLDLVERQEESFHVCQQLAPDLFESWRDELTSAELCVEKLRRYVNTSAGRHPAARVPAAGEWFAATTRRMDVLRKLEIQLLQKLQNSCLKSKDHVELRRKQQPIEATLDPENLPRPLGSHLPPPLRNFGPPTNPSVLPTGVENSLANLLAENTRRLREVEEELTASRQAIEERKNIERAKGLLMEHRGLSEPEAYRLLRDEAMRRSCKMSELAVRVIETAACWQKGQIGLGAKKS